MVSIHVQVDIIDIWYVWQVATYKNLSYKSAPSAINLMEVATGKAPGIYEKSLRMIDVIYYL